MNFNIGTTSKGKTFKLPLDSVTQTFAVLAKKGYGKSYTASVLAEEMLKGGQQTIIIDPTGAWFGLRSSADGKSAGFPVVVFGGDHQDVPLEESAGEIIANALIDKRFSAILDLSHFRKSAANRFVGIFLETLYRKNREPLHLIVDEADAFAPQRSFGDDARTLGAMEDIVRRGRIRGIGCTLITQRPQIINKNVLTQVDTLICGNLSHPKDIDAIEEWIEVHADAKEAKAMIDSLPVLPKGTLWFWSPSWGEFFDKVSVRLRETFNSGATPKPGEKIRAPQKLAPVDIKALGQAITETVERKKADDPKFLKAEIAELKKKLSDGAASTLTQADIVRAVEAADKRWLFVIEEIYDCSGDVFTALEKFKAIVRKPLDASELKRPALPGGIIPKPVFPKVQSSDANSHETLRMSAKVGETLPKAERKILTVLAQRYPKSTEKRQLAVIAEYKHTGGGFNNALGALRVKGLIQGSSEMEITDEGLTALGNYEPLPVGDALIEHWQTQFPKAERMILQTLRSAYPEKLSKQEIAARCDYEPTGGGFNNALGRLRTYELIEGSQNIKIKDSVFG